MAVGTSEGRPSAALARSFDCVGRPCLLARSFDRVLRSRHHAHGHMGQGPYLPRASLRRDERWRRRAFRPSSGDSWLKGSPTRLYPLRATPEHLLHGQAPTRERGCPPQACHGRRLCPFQIPDSQACHDPTARARPHRLATLASQRRPRPSRRQSQMDDSDTTLASSSRGRAAPAPSMVPPVGPPSLSIAAPAAAAPCPTLGSSSQGGAAAATPAPPMAPGGSPRLF